MPRPAKLSRETIVRAAMEILDREGERGFSMRKLAADLGVDPMALYHHFANRRALLHAVLETMMAQCPVPPPGKDWREDLRNLCNGLRDLARRHPGTFRAYELYDEWLSAEHRLREAVLATLRRAGFPPRRAVQAARLLLTYAEAFAVDEISGWMEPFDAAERTAFEASLPARACPVTADLAEEIGAVDPDADFDFALDTLIRGLESSLR